MVLMFVVYILVVLCLLFIYLMIMLVGGCDCIINGGDSEGVWF